MLNTQAIVSCLILAGSIGILTNVEDSEISNEFEDILNIFIIIFNSGFICYSGYIMMIDFTKIIRNKLQIYLTCSEKLHSKLLKPGIKEFKAKQRWKKIKQILYLTILDYHEILEQSEEKPNFFDVFKKNYISTKNENLSQRVIHAIGTIKRKSLEVKIPNSNCKRFRKYMSDDLEQQSRKNSRQIQRNPRKQSTDVNNTSTKTPYFNGIFSPLKKEENKLNFNNIIIEKENKSNFGKV